jgi:hypothetical protein
MDLIALRKLEAAAGEVLKRYHDLLRASDASQHGSPAMLAKAKFEAAWQADPVAVAQEAEQQVGYGD